MKCDERRFRILDRLSSESRGLVQRIMLVAAGLCGGPEEAGCVAAALDSCLDSDLERFGSGLVGSEVYDRWEQMDIELTAALAEEPEVL